MKDIINNENIFRSALIDTSAAEVQAEIERKKFADQAAYKEDELRAEQKKLLIKQQIKQMRLVKQC